MEIKIQSIHFDATEKLEAFIEKKVAKLEQGCQAGYCSEQAGQPDGNGAGHDALCGENE